MVISVAGSVLDAAAVAKISKTLVKAGRTFEETKDVAQTKKLLEEAGLDVETKQKVVKALEQEANAGKVEFINGYTKEKILNIPKGERPNFEEYLSARYIKAYLKKFEKGASYLVPKKALDKYGRDIIGRLDGQFVMSKTEMDDLLKKAKGNLSYVEDELGIPSGWWKDEELVRIDIPNVKQQNIRMPTGNESGANELWLPGGRLPKGYSEAVMDAIKKGDYKEINLNLK